MREVSSIIEGLNYNRWKDKVINEAVKVAYDNADKMKRSSRIIRKTFGKIKVPKEEWFDMNSVMSNPDSEESPLKSMYKSKYFNLRASYEDFPIEEVLGMLKRIKNIDFDRIIRTIYRGSKEKFHIEQISNLRLIFQSDRNKNHRLELRYDRKLFKRDSGEDVDDTIDTPEDSMENIENSREVMDSRATIEADKFKDEDQSKSIDMRNVVIERLSNNIKTFEKEKSIDMHEISSKSGASAEVCKASAVIADDVFENSAKEEPGISKDIVNTVKSLGGIMYGLDFRLKQPTSLGRKIATDTVVDGLNVKEAASDIKDSIRYTAIFDLEDFTEKYFATKSALENLGYVELRCKNFYIAYRNNKSEQKAIQCVYFKKPDGVKFEFQFHTVESQGAKEVNHPLYEDFRGSNISAEEKLVLSKRMTAIGETVPDPEGVFDIPEHK